MGQLSKLIPLFPPHFYEHNSNLTDLLVLWFFSISSTPKSRQDAYSRSKRRRTTLQPILPLRPFPRKIPPRSRAHRFRRPATHTAFLDRESAHHRADRQANIFPSWNSTPRRWHDTFETLSSGCRRGRGVGSS